MNSELKTHLMRQWLREQFDDLRELLEPKLKSYEISRLIDEGDDQGLLMLYGLIQIRLRPDEQTEGIERLRAYGYTSADILKVAVLIAEYQRGLN